MALSINVNFLGFFCYFTPEILFLSAILIVDCLGTFYLLVELDLTDFPERGGLEDGGFIDFTDC